VADGAALSAGLLAGTATALLLHRPAGARLAQVVRAPPRPVHANPGRRARRPPAAGDRRPLAACLVLAASCLLMLPPLLALPVAGLVVGLGPRVLGRLEPAQVRRERDRLRGDLPLLLDLLAACLAGGASLPAAASAVAGAVGGPAGQRLAVVAGALRVGTTAAEAWTALAGADPDGDPLAPAARALARAAEGGAPVAAAVARLAADARQRARSDGEQAARRAGVLAVAPLGLCFLPAFVLLGIVPVVAGLARPLLTGS